LPILAGLKQAAAYFAASEQFDLGFRITADHFQRMTAHLRKSLKVDLVIGLVDWTLQFIFKIER
jgi:hypothetical protein